MYRVKGGGGTIICGRVVILAAANGVQPLLGNGCSHYVYCLLQMIDVALLWKDDQCCLHKSKVVHEREKRMRPDWPPIYTILMVAFMAPQLLETCTFYSESCRLYKVQCTMYILQNEALWLRLLPASMSQSWHAYLQQDNPQTQRTTE